MAGKTDSGSRQTASGQLWAGVATQSIAPDWKVVLPYGRQVETDVFYNRNIFVKALVLKVGELEVALVELDLIGSRWDATRVIKSEITKETGIPAEKIILGAVHNHSYPRLADPKVLSLVAKQSARAVRSARAGMFPAMCGADMRTMPGNLSINRSWTRGSVNSELFVVRLDDLAGCTRAVIFNCGIHPTCFTTSWGDNKVGMIGPEWPEYVRRQVSFYQAAREDYLRHDAEMAYQPPFTMFTYGAAGDQQGALWLGEINGGKVSTLKAFTDTIARDITNMVDWIMTGSAAEMSYEAREVEVAVGPWEGTGGRRKTVVQLLSINDIAFVAIPGELVYDMGREVTRLSPFRYTIPVTIANDYVGYIVSEGEAAESITYESKGSEARPELGPIIMETIADLLHPGFVGKTRASLGDGFQFGAVAGTIRCRAKHDLVVGVMNKIEGPSSSAPFWGKRAVVGSDGRYRIDKLLPGTKYLYVKKVSSDYAGKDNQDLQTIAYGIPVEILPGKAIEKDFDFPPDLFKTAVKSIQVESITAHSGQSEISGTLAIMGSKRGDERIAGLLFHAGMARYLGVSGSQRRDPFLHGSVGACVADDSARFRFENVAPGAYVACFWLDVNANGIVEPGVDVISPLSKPVVVE